MKKESTGIEAVLGTKLPVIISNVIIIPAHGVAMSLLIDHLTACEVGTIYTYCG